MAIKKKKAAAKKKVVKKVSKKKVVIDMFQEVVITKGRAVKVDLRKDPSNKELGLKLNEVIRKING